MNAATGSRKLGRSVGAILAGILGVIVLSTATDFVLHAAGVFPPVGEPMSDALFLLALAYRLVFTIAGGYATAWLAPSRRLRHAVWLGAIGTFLALAGVVATWGKGPEIGPRWYPIALVVTALPCTSAGALLRRNRVVVRSTA